MKIGVITWFKYENYGTVLQAVALQKYLRSIGADTELVNYKLDDRKVRKHEPINFYAFTGKILHRIAKAFYKEEDYNKSFKFQEFLKRNCRFSRLVDNSKNYIKLCNSYDYLFFGSDQIWNPEWYSSYYFGNFQEIMVERVAYAPSFGVMSIPDELKETYAEALERFAALSVREKSGIDIIKALIGKNAELVVDPTLLLAEKEWEEMERRDFALGEDYILCYMLTDNKNHWKAIRAFVRQKKMKLVIIPSGGHSYFERSEIKKDCGPEDFLALIHGAKYVITDSFHGSIFSLIYKKQFFVFERHSPKSFSSQNSRIYSLLKLLDLEPLLQNYNSDSIRFHDSINYALVWKKLDRFIGDSKRYIKKSLGEQYGKR